MADIKNILLHSLECAICSKYMCAPISICSKGLHNACKNCIMKFRTCSYCKDPFLETRNLALENLAYQIDISCQKCKKKYSLPKYCEHYCIYNETYKCRIKCYRNNRIKKCHWQGYGMDIVTHFKETHPLQFFHLEQGKKFSWDLCCNEDQENISLFVYADQLFLQEVYYECKINKVYFAISNLNHNDDFKFQIDIPGQTLEGHILQDYKSIHDLRKSESLIGFQMQNAYLDQDKIFEWILTIF